MGRELEKVDQEDLEGPQDQKTEGLMSALEHGHEDDHWQTSRNLGAENQHKSVPDLQTPAVFKIFSHFD